MENEKITDLKEMLLKSVQKYADKTLYKLDKTTLVVFLPTPSKLSK